MKERLGALEAEKARLVAELAKVDTAPVALHPNLPALYRKKVEDLEAVLAASGHRQGPVRNKLTRAARGSAAGAPVFRPVFRPASDVPT